VDQTTQQPNDPGVWRAALDVLGAKATELEREMAELQAGAADAALTAETGGDPGALLALREAEASIRARLADVALARGKAEEKLAEACEAERVAEVEARRQELLALIGQRQQLALRVDDALANLEKVLRPYRAVGDLIEHGRRSVGLGDGLGLSTGELDDTEQIPVALWKLSPTFAQMLRVPRPVMGVPRTMAEADNAIRLQMRLNHG
jgi:hypothetical protein